MSNTKDINFYTNLCTKIMCNNTLMCIKIMCNNTLNNDSNTLNKLYQLKLNDIITTSTNTFTCGVQICRP